MANETSATIGKSLLLHRSEESGGFRLDRLGKKSPSAIAENRGQGIIDRVGMSKCGNGAIRRHGRIAPSGGSGRSDHPPRYAASFRPSSPSFRHSSSCRIVDVELASHDVDPQ